MTIFMENWYEVTGYSLLSADTPSELGLVALVLHIPPERQGRLHGWKIGGYHFRINEAEYELAIQLGAENLTLYNFGERMVQAAKKWPE